MTFLDHTDGKLPTSASASKFNKKGHLWNQLSVRMGPMGEDAEADGELLVAEPETKTKRPSFYRVILLNDDYTPMEFVVQILEQVFSHDRTLATRIMLEVHTKGKGVCGVYTYDVAETKVAQVTNAAEQNQHPLLCTMEAD